MKDILIPAVDLSLVKGSTYKFREANKPHSRWFVHHSFHDSKTKGDEVWDGEKDIGNIKVEFQVFKNPIILSFLSVYF